MNARSAAPALVNAEAERAVLGKILTDDRQFYDVADRLKPDDFGEIRHSQVYASMQSLIARGEPITRPAVLGMVTAEHIELDQVNMAGYLAGLIAEVAKSECASVAIGHFAEIVLHRSSARRLIKAAQIIHDHAKTATIDRPIEELRQEALALISADDNESSGSSVRFRDLMTKVIKNASSVERQGIRTGFDAWDRLVGSMLPGQLIILGGETSSGKTALAAQVAYLCGARGIPTEIYELEMADIEIGSRWMSALSAISSEKLIEGGLLDDDIERLVRAGDIAGDPPIWIDDRPSPTVGTLQVRLARAIRSRGIQLAIIDHLQYVRADNGKADERERIRQVVDDIKAMAKRLRIPVILVSHVSRQVDVSLINTADDIKRPELRDLYGSSAIEKAADVVVFTHRPIYFLERATPKQRLRPQYEADVLSWSGRAELVQPKRRNGKGFAVSQCDFDEERTWFS